MITVITPCMNAAKHIAACIAHVADEAIAGFEHLVVDGGSTDGTVSILREAQQRHPHLRWVSEPDRGQSDAMNRGIALARHDLIAFLNVDDYFESDTLRRIAAHPSATQANVLLVGNCRLRGARGERYAVVKPKRLNIDALLLDSRLAAFPPNPSAYFYDKRLHARTGPYDIALRYAMDLDFLLKAVGIARVVYVDEVWGNFVLHEGSKTVSNASGSARERALVFARHRMLRPAVPRIGAALLRPLVVLDNAAFVALLRAGVQAARTLRRAGLRRA